MAPHPPYRILVVDDDADIRLVVQTALSPKYEVVCAHDGLDALAKLDQYEPDLVIMDTVMPLMDGLQACEAIRRKPAFKNIQVMFLSAHTTREEIAQTYQSGGNLFIPKPIEPSRLLRNIDLFFERTPPPWRPKRMSLRQIEMLEANFRKSQGPGREDTPLPAPAPVRVVSPPAAPPPAPPSAPPAAPPRPAAPPPPKAPAPHSARPAGTGMVLVPRILIVEDDKDLANVMTMALTGSFEVVTAGDGLEGVEKVARYEPDLVIIDVMLPKMNGYQLCQSIRRNIQFAKVPIVFVTAKASPKEREYALRAGADAFVAKPFEMDELVAVCMGFTLQPGFRVRPKTYSAHQMHAEELQIERERRQRDQRSKPPFHSERQADR